MTLHEQSFELFEFEARFARDKSYSTLGTLLLGKFALGMAPSTARVRQMQPGGSASPISP